MSPKKKKEGFREIPISKVIEPGERIRLEISEEAIEELAQSIKSQGQLQPIEVVKVGEKYEIVFGHRRWLACKRLKEEKIWARVVEKTKEQVAIGRATENLARAELSGIEEGAIYKDLIDNHHLRIDRVAGMVGKSVGTVKRKVSFMRMPASFQKAIHKGLISGTVGEELWSCADNSHREYLLQLAIDHGITAAVARQWVVDYRKSKQRKLFVDDGGGEEQEPMEGEKIYRSCDVCRGPVELSMSKDMRVCPECYRQIIGALKGG